MRTLTALLALISTSTFAAPLLGTANSFANSPFCQEFLCDLLGKDALGPSLSDFRYKINFPTDRQTAPDIVSVIRQNNRVLSGNWVSINQDSVLHSNDYGTLVLARLVEEMTGKRPTPQTIVELSNKCKKTAKQEVVLPWPVNGTTYRLSCMSSREYFDAWRFSFHVYLP